MSNLLPAGNRLYKLGIPGDKRNRGRKAPIALVLAGFLADGTKPRCGRVLPCARLRSSAIGGVSMLADEG